MAFAIGLAHLVGLVPAFPPATRLSAATTWTMRRRQPPQVRDITARLTEAGHSRERDPPILVIADASMAHAARLLAR
jgi:hypothetical protein